MMIKNLQEVAESTLRDISFNLDDWSVVLSDSHNVDVNHQKSTIEYYVSYFEGKNLSFVLYENNKPVGVFPLFIHKDQEGYLISGDGSNLINPLFISNIAKKTKKRLEGKIIEIIQQISKKIAIKKIQLFDTNTVLSSWYLLWLERANRSFSTYQLAINLEHSIDEIRLGFRKSYKPLTNKALKDWDISICNDNLDENFEAFRLLHLEVVGKETRGRETWDIQKQQIVNNEAFLVMVKDNDTLIGAGLFSYTKDMGVYAVGAYKRELFDKPIGHGVQIKAIEFLKEKNCKRYLIGQKMTALDESQPTDKEMSISHFKEGFASYVYIQPHLDVSV
jgi:FemAB family protein